MGVVCGDGVPVVRSGAEVVSLASHVAGHLNLLILALKVNNNNVMIHSHKQKLNLHQTLSEKGDSVCVCVCVAHSRGVVWELGQQSVS